MTSSFIFVAVPRRCVCVYDRQDDLQKLQGTLDLLIHSSVGADSTEGSVAQTVALVQ